MEADRWQLLEELFHSALSLPVAERSAFLANACASDGRMQGEVESLLTVFENQDGFLEETVFEKGLQAIATNGAPSLAGETIGSYQLLRLLGKGGMGEVYLAKDLRLDRQVALKFLAPKLINDNWAKRQMIKEAQAAARLDHPNICTLHGLEEANGTIFIVMQYIEGAPLTSLICKSGREGGESGKRLVDADHILPLVLQMAGALAAAHAHGIIHRDIKPQNIMVTANWQLKVLDFGLAKIILRQDATTGRGEASSQQSQPGLIMGTVAYMSPEQLCAEKLDYRTDIFSLGVMLYELTSGEHPFLKESNAETIATILTKQPPALHLANGLPHALGPIIHKCLEKEKEKRYQSASELLVDLENIGADIRPSLFYFKLYAAAALSLLLIVAAVLAYRHFTRVPTLAILPFVKATSDLPDDYFTNGFTDSLADQLSRLPSLKLKTATGAPAIQTDLNQIGRELGVNVMLAGEVTRETETRFLRVRLVEVEGGKVLWAEAFDLNHTEALSLQKALTAKVAEHLRLNLTREDQLALGDPQAVNAQAFDQYLRGRYFWNKRGKENIQQAMDFFQRAIDIHPTYARAYTGLADCYVLLSSVAYGEMPTKEAMTKARSAAKQALEIDPRSPEAHTSLGVVKLLYEWNWQEAEAEFQQAIKLNQEYAPAHYWNSTLLMITKRPAESIAESEAARDLAPLSPSMNLNRCRASFWARQYEQARGCVNKMLEKDPANIRAQYVLGYIYQELGMYEKAIEIFQPIYNSTENKFLGATPLAYAYGMTGRKAEALKILDEMKERSRQTYLPPQEIAIVYIGLGEKDEAFKWLERAYDERFAYLIYLTVEPLFDHLRPDPRYADLAQRLKLSPEL